MGDSNVYRIGEKIELEEIIGFSGLPAFTVKPSTPGCLGEFYALQLRGNRKSDNKLLKSFTRKHGIHGLSVTVSNRGRVTFRSKLMIPTIDDARRLVNSFVHAARLMLALRNKAMRKQAIINRQRARRAKARPAYTNRPLILTSSG